MSQEVDISEVGRLFQSKFGLIVSVARQYAPDPDMVYDIAQQVFLDFAGLALKGGYDTDSDKGRDVTPLLYEMTKNRALKAWRELRDRIPENRRRIAEQLMETARRRAQDAEPEQRFDALYDCLDRLPEKSREMIRKHYFDAVSIVELAEKQQKNPDALRQMFARIRVKLKKCIEKR